MLACGLCGAVCRPAWPAWRRVATAGPPRKMGCRAAAAGGAGAGAAAAPEPAGAAAGTSAAGASAAPRQLRNQQRPVLLFDVMDTIVYDPFYEDMPRFFQVTFKELLESKHPTAWVEFERAAISQEELFAKFFKDGREFDGPALVDHMVASYRFLDGMEELLQRLHSAGYRLHAMSNYPLWYRHIEQKLQLSRFLHWTFVSCEGVMQGHRKPAPGSFQCVVEHLGLPPSDLLLIDDRQQNVEGARQAGLQAIQFSSAPQLEAELCAAGLAF